MCDYTCRLAHRNPAVLILFMKDHCGQNSRSCMESPSDQRGTFLNLQRQWMPPSSGAERQEVPLEPTAQQQVGQCSAGSGTTATPLVYMQASIDPRPQASCEPIIMSQQLMPHVAIAGGACSTAALGQNKPADLQVLELARRLKELRQRPELRQRFVLEVA